jgi:hypothetical protein
MFERHPVMTFNYNNFVFMEPNGSENDTQSSSLVHETNAIQNYFTSERSVQEFSNTNLFWSCRVKIHVWTTTTVFINLIKLNGNWLEIFLKTCRQFVTTINHLSVEAPSCSGELPTVFKITLSCTYQTLSSAQHNLLQSWLNCSYQGIMQNLACEAIGIRSSRAMHVL